MAWAKCLTCGGIMPVKEPEVPGYRVRLICLSDACNPKYSTHGPGRQFEVMSRFETMMRLKKEKASERKE